MKITLIRALVVAMLATSMSAFAVTNDSKAEAVSPCTNQKETGARQNTDDSGKDKKSKQKRHNDQKEENSDQFLGIWG